MALARRRRRRRADADDRLHRPALPRRLRARARRRRGGRRAGHRGVGGRLGGPPPRVVVTATAVLLVRRADVNVGLAVLARNVYLLPTEAERRDFVAAQYAIQDRLGGGRPPDVVEIDALGPAAPDGTVAIVGDCDGLYRSDGDAWVLLEQRAGGLAAGGRAGRRRPARSSPATAGRSCSSTTVEGRRAGRTSARPGRGPGRSRHRRDRGRRPCRPDHPDRHRRRRRRALARGLPPADDGGPSAGAPRPDRTARRRPRCAPLASTGCG